MNVLRLNAEDESVDIRFDKHELAFLYQSANEVRNGVDIPDSEFETRLGYRRDFGNEVLDRLMGTMRKLWPSRP